MKITAILLAAGGSRRMGADKLALSYRGERVLYRALAPLVCSDRIEQVIAVVRPAFTWPDGPMACQLVTNPNWEQGMGTSLAAGVAAAPVDSDAFLVALADMPKLALATVHRLIDTFDNGDAGIVRPVFEGRPGHPVIFDRSFRAKLADLGGDTGAKHLIEKHRDQVLEVPVDDPGVVFDIDTPKDLSPAKRILVKGAGEMASAVAHRLFECGFQIIMTEVEHPTTIRRRVAFASAIHVGAVDVEGVPAAVCTLDQQDIFHTYDGQLILVFVDPEAEIIDSWRPHVVVDARMLKHETETHMGEAPLVIGLGPGYDAGRDVHVVVETNRGHDLGRLITSGSAQPNTSEPGSIKGSSLDRVLRSPADGLFEAANEIGDLVNAGDNIGEVQGQPVMAGLDGVVRGLIRPGSTVHRGQKIGDIDPRGDVSYCCTISDKARAIGGSVLHAILRYSPNAGP